MKKQTIKNLTTASLIAVATISSPAAVLAAGGWGPSEDRETFTMENPAPYATFNSITNNTASGFGDERKFVGISEIKESESTVLDYTTVEIVPGNQYMVEIFFHNDASSSLNDAAHDYVGVAMGTTMSSEFTKVITPSNPGQVYAEIKSTTTKPESVYATADMTTTAGKVVLRYVEGSATMFNDHETNGQPMKEALFSSEGTPIGLTSFDGVIPGCEEYQGVVAYILQAEELVGTIDKTVSADGITFEDDLTEIEQGSEVTFMLTVKNSGDTSLTLATVKDILPEGITLVPGSVQFWRDGSDTKDTIPDDILFDTGAVLTPIPAGAVVHYSYKAKVTDGYDCGQDIKLSNKATLTYNSETQTGDTDEDSASISVAVDECEAPEELPNTGPAEIVMAVLVVLGITGGGFYLWRTRRTLKTVENDVSGKDSKDGTATPMSSTGTPMSSGPTSGTPTTGTGA